MSNPLACHRCGAEITVIIDPQHVAREIHSLKEALMGALENLQANDAELLAAVTNVVSGVNRLEADFVNLQQAIATGDLPAIQIEADKVANAVAALKGASDTITTTDPETEPTEPAPVDGSGDAPVETPVDQPTE
jgi:hypothetical protein